MSHIETSRISAIADHCTRLRLFNCGGKLSFFTLNPKIKATPSKLDEVTLRQYDRTLMVAHQSPGILVVFEGSPRDVTTPRTSGMLRDSLCDHSRQTTFVSGGVPQLSLRGSVNLRDVAVG